MAARPAGADVSALRLIPPRRTSPLSLSSLHFFFQFLHSFHYCTTHSSTNRDLELRVLLYHTIIALPTIPSTTSFLTLPHAATSSQERTTFRQTSVSALAGTPAYNLIQTQGRAISSTRLRARYTYSRSCLGIAFLQTRSRLAIDPPLNTGWPYLYSGRDR